MKDKANREETGLIALSHVGDKHIQRGFIYLTDGGPIKVANIEAIRQKSWDALKEVLPGIVDEEEEENKDEHR